MCIQKTDNLNIYAVPIGKTGEKWRIIMSIYNALLGLPHHPVKTPKRFILEGENFEITHKPLSELKKYRGTYVIDCEYNNPLEWCGLTNAQQDKVIEYIKKLSCSCIVFINGRPLIDTDRHYHPYVIFNAWGGVGKICDGKWVLKVPEGTAPFRVGCINTGTGALTDFVCDHELVYGNGKVMIP